MAIKDFKALVQQEAKLTKEYKNYLAVAGEEGLPWYSASKMVMEYLHPNQQLKADDYKEINKLRRWYNEQYGEEA